MVSCIIIISDIDHYDVFVSLTFLSMGLPNLQGNCRNNHNLHASEYFLPGVISHSCWL